MLYDAVLYTPRSQKETRIRSLFMIGANPNYMPPYSDHTIVECAAEYQSEDIVRLFVNNQATDFNPRPGYESCSPLALLLKEYTDEYRSLDLLCAIYRRMKKPHGANSPLLKLAIRAGRVDFAAVLIADRHAFHQIGYYHMCAYLVDDDEAATCARLLYDRGYRYTGLYDDGRDPSNPYYVNVTALETAVSWGSGRLEHCGVLVPFAEITLRAIDQLACDDNAAFYVIDLLRRCRLRDLALETDHRPVSTTLQKSILCHARGVPAIPSIVSHHKDIPCLYRTNTKVPVAHPYSSVNGVELLIIELLKQGEMPHESMATFPALQEAMLPWTPRLTPLYFPGVFVHRAKLLLVCIELSRDVCPMPIEMEHRIVQFVDRTYYRCAFTAV